MPKQQLREKLWRDQYPDRCREYESTYRERNREILRERSRLWRLNNKEKCKEHRKNTSEASKLRKKLYNAEYQKTYCAIYRAKNKEALKPLQRQYAATRRSRILGTKTERISYVKLINEFNGLCGICLQPLSLATDLYHFDHIIPLSKNGQHIQSNLQIAHGTCNLKKSANIS